jgi:uncharacterized phiE125 gp8 family phage protein
VKLKIITDAAVEFVSLVEMRAQCRLVAVGSPAAHPEDDLLKIYITAAREWAENFCARTFAVKTLELSLDAFPADGQILMPGSPVVSVASVTCVLPDGGEFVVPPAAYELIDYGIPHILKPIHGGSWPQVRDDQNVIRVRYQAGYAALLPTSVRQAILLLAAHYYEHRESASEQKTETIPHGVAPLLAPYRILGI